VLCTALISLWISSPPVLKLGGRILEVEPTAQDWAGVSCLYNGSRRYHSDGLTNGWVLYCAGPDVFSCGLGTVGVDPEHYRTQRLVYDIELVAGLVLPTCLFFHVLILRNWDRRSKGKVWNWWMIWTLGFWLNDLKRVTSWVYYSLRAQTLAFLIFVRDKNLTNTKNLITSFLCYES
jgi:hypothetical protein